MTGPLMITAWLSTPIAGDPPQLDSLMEWSLSPFDEQFHNDQKQGVPHHRIDRALPSPKQGEIRIPIYREWVGKFLVARCSDAIIPLPKADAVDYICKRIAVESSWLLQENERKVVTTTNSWTKSYRLPLRIRLVDRVIWFAVGNRRNTQKCLRDVHAIGKKVADGYGRVSRWEVADIDNDYSWFAPSNAGPVLMRTMPLDAKCLPVGIVGAKRGFGACCPPYWHPDRYGEILQPC